ncbi:hypothetical protein WDW37_10835 [Bdellovibrionota bacterium FG-1]
MPGSIFISKWSLLLLGAASLTWGPLATDAMAAEPTSASPNGNASSGKAGLPEEDDFSTTPFTEYGEFNEDKDEEEDAKYFAYGRFFGVSLGLGFEGVTGNRGALWQGGIPLVDFRLHYWFDFNFAIDLGGYYAAHNFNTAPDHGGHVDVNLFHIGADVKYYFDTKNLSAPISFANPYVLLGFGSYTKTESSYVTAATNQPSMTAIGLTFGAGLEFAIKPKKSYFEFEGKYHVVNFSDNGSDYYKDTNHVPDLTGGFYTLEASILFTW